MTRRALWLLLSLVVVAGCSAGGARSHGSTEPAAPTGEVRAPDPRAPASVTAAGAAALRSGNAAFAGRLLELLSRQQQTVAFSPFSVSQALAMLYAGARVQTAAQIARALDFRLPPARLHGAFNALDQALARADRRRVTLNVADALFGQRGFGFREPFLSLLARDYGTGMHTVDFQDEPGAARLAINRWVQSRTHGKIPTLLDRRDTNLQTVLVLVNALYLHAAWLAPFTPQDTSPAPFHAPSGTVTVPTMHQTAQFPYLQAAGYRAVELPYQGGRLALDILLPDPGQRGALLAGLGARNPLDLLRGLHPETVRLALPRLLLRTRFELKQALEALGMQLAFIPGAADLSGIAGGPGDLYVQAVAHEAYLKVDEAGTEAAAATGVIVGITSLEVPRVTFTVDRPFVFMLRDRKTGAILFMGTVTHP